jgi:hypothetical protein
MKVIGLGSPDDVRIRFDACEIDVLVDVLRDLRAKATLFRYDERGRLTDLWHVWNTLLLARQLGAPAPDLRIGAT